MESLPVEVISHILTFLHNSDAISFALCAKKFYNAYHDPQVLKSQNLQLRFDNCRLDLLHVPLSIFAKSTVNYPRLVLGAGIQPNINEDNAFKIFWTNFGWNIKDLTIETPGNLGFQLLVKFMPNLRVLRILSKGRAITFKKEEDLKKCLYRVHSLEISANYEQFEDLLELLPSLEFLTLEGFSCKQLRTFTRNSSLSLQYLTHYITKVRAIELKGLILHSYCVEEDSNEKFFFELAASTGLLLKELACSIEGVSIPLLEKLFHKMEKTLKRLDLTSWALISAEIYKIIFMHLKNIEELTFRGKLTLEGLHHISGLKNLRVLRFKDSFEILEIEKKSHFLQKLTNLNLKELQIDTKCLNSAECECFYEFMNSGVAENLQILNISRSNIDDKNLSFLMSYAKNLKQLYMSDCKNVTTFEDKSLRKLEVLEISHCHNLTENGLGKIFDDFHTLRWLFANNLEAITPSVIYAISTQCPSLEKLSIANCPQLTDQCIEFTTNLPRLHHLDISGCKKLTKITEYALWKSSHLRILHAVGMERLEMSIIMLFAKIPTLQLYRCDKDYTRVEFEAKKYLNKKVQNIKRCLVFAHITRDK